MCLILGIVPSHSLNPGDRIDRYTGGFLESVVSLIVASRASGVNNTTTPLLSQGDGVIVSVHIRPHGDILTANRA